MKFDFSMRLFVYNVEQFFSVAVTKILTLFFMSSILAIIFMFMGRFALILCLLRGKDQISS